MRLRIWHMLVRYVTCGVHAPCVGEMAHLLDMGHVLVDGGAIIQAVIGFK